MPQRGFFPQPAYLIGCFREDGTPNFTLTTWVTYAAAEPPTLLFTARNAGLGKKKTADRILETNVFSANLVTVSMIDEADYCGVTSGYDSDKVAITGLAWSRGAILDVPVLDASPWVFECQVVQTIVVGDGAVYFGQIRNILVDERIPDPTRGKVDVPALDPVIYAPNKYYALGRKVLSVGDSRKKFAPAR